MIKVLNDILIECDKCKYEILIDVDSLECEVSGCERNMGEEIECIFSGGGEYVVKNVILVYLLKLMVMNILLEHLIIQIMSVKVDVSNRIDIHQKSELRD